jgi:hypothetical protein
MQPTIERPMRVAHHPPSLLQPLNQVLSPLRADADGLFDTTNIQDVPMHFLVLNWPGGGGLQWHIFCAF